MCDEESNGIGGIVPNDRVIFRACMRSNCLSGAARDTVEPITFQKEGRKHKDGLSLAFSAAACARYCPRNYGIVRISVAAVHQLNRNLEVHFDTTDPDHAIIRNLPCTDREPPEKELALAVSSELAAASEIESSKRVITLAPPDAAPL
jgi:hypothetical protein